MLKGLSGVLGLMSRSPLERKCARFFSRSLCTTSNNPCKTVTVEAVEDPYYLALFTFIAQGLFVNHDIRFDYVTSRSLNVGESRSLKDFIVSRLFVNSALNIKWRKIYEHIGFKFAYSSTKLNILFDFIDFGWAVNTWRKLENNWELVALNIDGLLVGDLVNDSFLRFKPAASVKVSDPYLLMLIWQAKRDLRRAKRYFSNQQSKIFLTSYSSYIQHGIAVRVALSFNVAVYAFGNYQEFKKLLTKTDFFHTRNAYNYFNDYHCLHDKAKITAIERAQFALGARIAGRIDAATAYMKRSAYSVTVADVPDVKGAIVIFLHDFFDSPHVYPNMIFPDFWTWVCFTLDTLTSLDCRYFVKAHPNQIDLNVDVLANLNARYPQLMYIPNGITNKQLVDAGIIAGVTVYGTVSHELAYLGIPTIGCADHPHISFDFCFTAKSLDEYRQLLLEVHKLSFDKCEAQLQSKQFYFMHNLNHDQDELILLDRLRQLRDRCEGTFSHIEDTGTSDLLRSIKHLPAFERHILDFVQWIE